MTQNRFVLGITSFLIVFAVFAYIADPFAAAPVYASERTYLDSNNDGVVSGQIQSSGSLGHNVPITVNGFDDNNDPINIASGNSDKNGNFAFTIDKSLIPVLHNHKIIISFTVNGKTYTQTLMLMLDDQTFKELFVDHALLPLPFTVFAY